MNHRLKHYRWGYWWLTGVLFQRGKIVIQLMRIPAVVKATGLPRSSLYRMVREGKFPKPIKLSARASAWRLDEVERWGEERTKASRPTAEAA